jgi:glycosyltransferase involved in cell wall biosynthesis
LTKSILFFADRLPPLVGGMEMHAGAFLEHFSRTEAQYAINYTITKNEAMEDCLVLENKFKCIDLFLFLSKIETPDIIFFNSGRWIEEGVQIKNIFPNALTLYRTGGNEIIKGQLTDMTGSLLNRQSFWVKTINNTIDVLITNSNYTNKRMLELGIKSGKFRKVVGGVNAKQIKNILLSRTGLDQGIRMFCAARFVPYKNHKLLIEVVVEILRSGIEVQLVLAGSGPLLDDIKAQSC